MLVASWIGLFVGILIICVGMLIWKKQKISLIHSYHYKKVKEKDKKAYTRGMGKGIVIIGMGCVFMGIINAIFQWVIGWIIFCLCFVYGFYMIYKIQKNIMVVSFKRDPRCEISLLLDRGCVSFYTG